MGVRGPDDSREISSLQPEQVRPTIKLSRLDEKIRAKVASLFSAKPEQSSRSFAASVLSPAFLAVTRAISSLYFSSAIRQVLAILKKENLDLDKAIALAEQFAFSPEIEEKLLQLKGRRLEKEHVAAEEKLGKVKQRLISSVEGSTEHLEALFDLYFTSTSSPFPSSNDIEFAKEQLQEALQENIGPGSTEEEIKEKRAITRFRLLDFSEISPEDKSILRSLLDQPLRPELLKKLISAFQLSPEERRNLIEAKLLSHMGERDATSLKELGQSIKIIATEGIGNAMTREDAKALEAIITNFAGQQQELGRQMFGTSSIESQELTYLVEEYVKFPTLLAFRDLLPDLSNNYASFISAQLADWSMLALIDSSRSLPVLKELTRDDPFVRSLFAEQNLLKFITTAQKSVASFKSGEEFALMAKILYADPRLFKQYQKDTERATYALADKTTHQNSFLPSGTPYEAQGTFFEENRWNHLDLLLRGNSQAIQGVFTSLLPTLLHEDEKGRVGPYNQQLIDPLFAAYTTIKEDNGDFKNINITIQQGREGVGVGMRSDLEPAEQATFFYIGALATRPTQQQLSVGQISQPAGGIAKPIRIDREELVELIGEEEAFGDKNNGSDSLTPLAQRVLMEKLLTSLKEGDAVLGDLKEIIDLSLERQIKEAGESREILYGLQAERQALLGMDFISEARKAEIRKELETIEKALPAKS